MFWYTVYCVLMALVYVACTILGVVLLALDMARLDPSLDPGETFAFRIQGYALVAIGIPLAIAFVIAPFLPRYRWAWIYGIVMIGIGMTSCCTLPFCIPLVIFWIKPEVKALFDQRRARD